jgi:hypothetical protein
MSNCKNNKNPYEDIDILELLMSSEEEAETKLTRERIRTIYSQLKYGSKKTYEIAAYYKLPVELIRDIRDGNVFRKITEDL